MHTPKTGIIYHVIDKTTGKVVKVGSTIQTLKRRFSAQDYQRKFKNHFVREVKTINSSELDWYEKGNAYCPFLWHLVAAEHLEILRTGTYRKGPFSNNESPLDQKFRGFDGSEYGRIGASLVSRETRVRGGITAGRRNAENGFMSALGKNVTPEERKKRCSAGGRKRVDSGFFSSEHQSKVGRLGGLIAGRNRAMSGLFTRIAGLGGHVRWHVTRGIVSNNCKFCKDTT